MKRCHLSLVLTALSLAGAPAPAHAKAPVASYPTVLPNGDQADVYHPIRSAPPHMPPAGYGVVAFLQGALVDKAHYSGFATELASYGFIVVVPNHFQVLIPGSGPQLFTAQSVVNAVLAGMTMQDADPASPVFGMVDESKLGVSGHSFGGAAALFAIDGRCRPPFCFGPPGSYVRPAALQAAALFGTNLVQGGMVIDVDTSAVPTALLQGELDGRAPPAEAALTYAIMEPPKALVSFAGINHYGITNDNAPPGATPDPNPPEVNQHVAIARVARWAAYVMSAHLYGDVAAARKIYEHPGSRGQVTVTSER